MRSLSRAVVVSAFALPLAFAGAGLASAYDGNSGWNYPHAGGQYNVCNIISCNDLSENHSTVQNFGILG
jgi:hypothetical protein